jgi:predicted ester cyclase
MAEEGAMNADPISRRAWIGGAAVLGLAVAAPRARAAAALDELHAGYHRLLDRYLAAVNAHDTSAFPEIFTEAYIQHSGRSPSGLQAQIVNFQRVFENWPDFQSRIEDRILGGDRIVARTIFSATHSRPVQGFAPSGKRVTWGAIDIWRVENGKLAEHWDIVDVAGLLKQLRGE